MPKHDKSFDKYPKDALIEISRRAGIASGKARRKKRKKIEALKLRDIAYQEQEAKHKQNIHEEISMLRHNAILLSEINSELKKEHPHK